MDGFRPIRLKPATVPYLILNDPQAADDILAHNEQGEQVAGWKPSGE